MKTTILESQMFRFEKIKVWEKSIRWAKDVYQCTRDFPHEERYGLTSQLRRSAVSVAANIAEGSSRNSNTDFTRFLEIADGSLMESVSHCWLAKELGYLSGESYKKLYSDATEIARMLSSFRHYLLSQKNESRVSDFLEPYDATFQDP